MSKEFTACLPNWTVHKCGSGQPQTLGPETTIWTDEHGSLILSKVDNGPSDRYRLRLSNEISVDISFDELLVCHHSTSGSVAGPAHEHFLIDQVLPRILGQQGQLVLHAAAVKVGDATVLLLGKSGSGKSTLAASFHGAGHALLGDDALIVSWPTQMANASAVYPSLRLFPDSIEAVFADDVVTASVAHYTHKLRVSVPLKDGGESGALPIRALFVLSPYSRETVLIERKSIAEACMALVENSFVLDPTDTDRAAGRLRDASRLAGEIPAFDLCYPRAYSRLADVQAAIFEALDQPA